jgi:prepilin-type N-terminal cleavage/methylation domain-containing protein
MNTARNTLIPPQAGRNAGFSLVEILAVLAIIIVLAGTIIGLARYAESKATQSKVRMEIANIDTSLQQYKIDKGAYPLSLVTLIDTGYLKNWPTNRITTVARELMSPYSPLGSQERVSNPIPIGQPYQYDGTNGLIWVISPDYTATNRNIGPP